MLLRPTFFPLLAFLTLMVVCGCGSGIQTEPVTGVVTMDGKPLPGVRVIFSPAEGGRANSVGTTDSEGAYSLVYTRKNAGAITGRYKVLVSKTKMTDEGEKETLPRKYNQETTFEAEVTSTGSNKFDYHLESE